MWQKLLNILLILTALLILGVSIHEVSNKYPNKQEDTILHQEWVGVVEEGESKARYETNNETLYTRSDSFEQIETYIQEVFGEGVGYSWATRVIICESSYNPSAFNPSGASGLFQFQPRTYYHYGGTDIWNWREQVRIAKKMFDLGEQNQWICK